MQINGYDLSRAWFNFCFENPDIIRPNHTAIYFFAIEHCNRLGWKEKFGYPTTMAMEATGIKSYNTYIKCLNELISWGFLKLIEKSKNQYSSNIIALSNFNKAIDKALDKALIKHSTKQIVKQDESTIQSKRSIDKQTNKEQTNKEQRTKNNTPLSEIKISDLEGENVEYFQIAKAFRDLFIKNLKEKNAPTKNQEKATFKNYVAPVRLMITNDGVSREQIIKVFKFLDSPEGDFWKPNILSTKKLREKFSQLIIKSQSSNGKQQPDKRTNQEIANDAFNSDTAKQFRFS